MKFFIDTADINQIHQANELGIIDGVTTNPSLIAKERVSGEKNIYKHYLNICDIFQGDVSAEVIAVDYKGMCYEGENLAKIHSQIVVKIPMTNEGIRAIHYLSNKGIRTNCTLVFSLSQALLAAKVGATYVSPFIGRLDDISLDGLQLIQDIRMVYNIYNFKTEILAASIRNPIHIINCAKIGTDIITASLEIIKSLVYHPLTDIGIKKFLYDHKKAFI